MDKIVVIIVFALIGVIILINLYNIFTNILFGKRSSQVEVVEEENPLRDELRAEIDQNIRPHLNSLEGMYDKSETDGIAFPAYVFGMVKEKLASFVEKDEALVEEEICKCCNDYDGAECKEDYCLEGTGISCKST